MGSVVVRSVLLLLFLAAASFVGPANAQPRFLSVCNRAAGLFSNVLGGVSLFSEDCKPNVQGIRQRTEELARRPGAAVAVASTGDGFNPFTVAGADETTVAEEAEDEVVLKTNPIRPEGPWEVIIETTVPVHVRDVWQTTRNFGNVLYYGLEGISSDVRSLDHKSTRWAVDLASGERIIFNVTSTEEEKFYHVVEIESHGPNVFPGVDISKSLIFVQFLGDREGTSTTIELGWGGNVVGPLDVAKTSVGTLGQQILAKLEEKFGETCDQGKNRRTIEGDCNNLQHPRRGAAGHALLRFGGSDPAFPDGDPTKPSGPVHISPRVISNKLCSQSPGEAIMEERSREMEGQCASKTEGDMGWEVCPYGPAALRRGTAIVFRLEWGGVKTLSDGTLMFSYKGEECELELVLMCGGSIAIDLVEGGCGQEGNRFFHPQACSIKPGEDDVLTSSKKLTDMFWTFGQFIDHDLDLTPVAQLADKKQPGFSKNSRPDNNLELPIPVPEDDFYIKEDTMEFERSILLKDRRRGLHENQHSAYADLGQLYGVDFLRARVLRTFDGGKLKTIAGGLPPYNKIDGHGALGAKVDNAPDPEDEFFAVGDIRGNEQTLLLAMHIVWIREHNLVCEELAALFPKWNDEQIYQTARAITIAEYQSIIYDEWLPLLLGEGVVASSDYSYNAGVDASISAIFSTAAFRFGHTMVGSHILKLGSGPRAQATLQLVPLREVFFKPAIVERDGIDDYLRGAAWHVCKEVDAKVVDELRNFLFTENSDEGHMDLVSLNIQRGRDMGLPSFNQLRSIFGLPVYGSFYDFIEDDHQAASSQYVYGDVDLCDALYGGFAEKTHSGSILGQTFFVVVTDQFTKIRDGDRFFFRALQWDPVIIEKYPRVNDIMRGKVKLGDILVRTTGITKSELGGRDTVFQL